MVAQVENIEFMAIFTTFLSVISVKSNNAHPTWALFSTQRKTLRYWGSFLRGHVFRRSGRNLLQEKQNFKSLACRILIKIDTILHFDPLHDDEKKKSKSLD